MTKRCVYCLCPYTIEDGHLWDVHVTGGIVPMRVSSAYSSLYPAEGSRFRTSNEGCCRAITYRIDNPKAAAAFMATLRHYFPSGIYYASI